MAVNKAVRDLLRSARDRKGYTQADMGRMLGMEGNSYGKIELGKNGLPSDLAMKISRLLGISPADLLMAAAGEAPDSSGVMLRFGGTGTHSAAPGAPYLRIRDSGHAVLFTPEEWRMHCEIAEFAGLGPDTLDAFVLSKPVMDAHALSECRRIMARGPGNLSNDGKECENDVKTWNDVPVREGPSREPDEPKQPGAPGRDGQPCGPDEPEQP